jgi:hypothetical protein
MTTSCTNTIESRTHPHSCAGLPNRGGYVTCSDRSDQRFGRRDGLSGGSLKIGVDALLLRVSAHERQFEMQCSSATEARVQARVWTRSGMSTRKSFSRLGSSGAMNSMRIFSLFAGIGFAN